MSSAFSIALSSLKAESAAIDTTGNNLANLNTDGFKESDVDFKNLFSQSMGGGTSYQSGLGVTLPINNQLFTQGAIQTSSAPLSAAIQGNGFFVVNSTDGAQLFTRDGNFVQNAAGELQTETGEAIQGWTATPTGINTSGAAGNIVLPSDTVLAPSATTSFSFTANLDSQATTDVANTFSAPMQVVDSLGNNQQLTIKFTQEAAPNGNTWDYDVSIPNSALSTGTAANANNPVTLTNGTGSVAFSSSGVLTAVNGAASTAPIALSNPPGQTLADGAATLNMNWSLYDANGVPQLTDYAQTSSLASSTQDGITPSELTSVGIQTGGQVVATYSNGQTRVEAQLAMAEIQNPTSLQNVGNNNLSIGADTATPAIGVPQTGGRGQILGGAVESSNVDMATEFTNLIVYQSAYQASSRVISTEQTLDQDLLQLIH
jgi:flagellar hook protein FlgE